MGRRARFAVIAGAVVAAIATLTARAVVRGRHPTAAGSFPSPPVTLPQVALAPGAAGAVTRIALTRPDDDDPARMQTIVLERTQTGWRLTAPLRTPASADKVETLLANLQELHVWKRLDAGHALYERYDLTADKALHVVAWAGREPARARVVDFYAGKSSEQGQLIRVSGSEGLFALVNGGPHGYQGFLYTRDLRGWREPGIFAFDARDVTGVEIANPHGVALFRRRGTGWTATMAPRRRNGTVALPGEAWPGFDGARVEEMLQAYHALAADDFGDASARPGAGLDRAEQTGGVVTIHLASTPQPLILRVGGPAPSRSRFAIAGSRWAVRDHADGAEDTLYALSPWTARWAIGDARLFEQAH